jgi:serine/threonine-protein kinase
VFCDLNPKNVLFKSNDRLHAKLTDFGLAVEADEDTPLGEPDVEASGQEHSMAPEQWGGSRSMSIDIYALGVMGWALVTGAAVFEATSIVSPGNHMLYREALMQMHLNGTPRDPRELRPEVPAALAATILSGLEKDPGRRPATAGLFAQAFDEASRRWGEIWRT